MRTEVSQYVQELRNLVRQRPPVFLEGLSRNWSLEGIEEWGLDWSPWSDDPQYQEQLALERQPEEAQLITETRLRSASRLHAISLDDRVKIVRDLLFWSSASLYTNGEKHFDQGASVLLWVEQRLPFPNRLRIWCLLRIGAHLLSAFDEGEIVSAEACVVAASEAFEIAKYLGDREFIGRAALIYASSLRQAERWPEAWDLWKHARRELTTHQWRAASALIGSKFALECPSQDIRLAQVLLSEVDGWEGNPIAAIYRDHERAIVRRLTGDRQGALEALKAAFLGYETVGYKRYAYLMLAEDLGPMLEEAQEWSSLADALLLTAPISASISTAWDRGSRARIEHLRLSAAVAAAVS